MINIKVTLRNIFTAVHQHLHLKLDHSYKQVINMIILILNFVYLNEIIDYFFNVCILKLKENWLEIIV